jgi:hypothetical protein
MNVNITSLTASPLHLIAVEAKGRDRTIPVSQYHRGVLGWSVLDSLSACSMVFCAWWLSAASAVNGLVHFDPHFSPLEAALLYAMLFPIVSHVFGLHNPLMQRDKLVLAVK